MGTDDDKITIRIPKRFLETIDFLVDLDDFSSRSEAVRTAIRDMIYARVNLVSDRIKQIQAAEAAIAEKETLRKQFLQK
ncbi:MAG TPA: ribbon-helix-helix domain-containing protein [Thermoplasmata archaeon]|nr:ribbon-helix-helix domain-containing protein [Thermoplasmata archaeon]